MLRLDPAQPPLWRSTTTLQFGIDAVAIVEAGEAWHLRLLRELERGVPEDALERIAVTLGAPRGRATAFVQRLAPALSAPPAPPRRITVQADASMATADVDIVAGALAATGLSIEREVWGDHREQPPAAAPVVLLGHHIIDPRRAGALMLRDLAHLPLVFVGGRIEAGPLVDPGRTACLSCLAAERRDADARWPLVAAQLVGREPSPVDAGRLFLGGLLAARVLSDAEQRGRRPTSHSVSLGVDALHPRIRAHRPHEDCLCRSPGRNAKLDDPAHLEPSSSRAFAQPA